MSLFFKVILNLFSNRKCIVYDHKFQLVQINHFVLKSKFYLLSFLLKKSPKTWKYWLEISQDTPWWNYPLIFTKFFVNFNSTNTSKVNTIENPVKELILLFSKEKIVLNFFFLNLLFHLIYGLLLREPWIKLYSVMKFHPFLGLGTSDISRNT